MAIALLDAHRDDPEFGYRFLADEARDAGFSACHRTMCRVCSANGWWSAFGKKRGKNGKKPGPPVHDDLVKRDFTADAPNQLWLPDINEHRTGEGRLYLCAIKDVFSNRILGYQRQDEVSSCRRRPQQRGGSPRRRRRLHLAHRPRVPVPVEEFVRALHRHDMVGSMGKVGAAGDDAAMESLFALLQKNVLDCRTWATRQELRIAIVTWTEQAYHRRRRQAALGGLTPSSTRPS